MLNELLIPESMSFETHLNVQDMNCFLFHRLIEKKHCLKIQLDIYRVPSTIRDFSITEMFMHRQIHGFYPPVYVLYPPNFTKMAKTYDTSYTF